MNPATRRIRSAASVVAPGAPAGGAGGAAGGAFAPGAPFERLRGLDGYLGACLFDAEACRLLAADGDAAGFGGPDAALVEAKARLVRRLAASAGVRDVLIGSRRHYVLIRPVQARAGAFFALALARPRANVALARYTLAEVERGAVPASAPDAALASERP
jgi:hypothetical protein